MNLSKFIFTKVLIKQSIFFIQNLTTIIALFCSTSVLGHTKDEWKSRTIYQLLTDRFWRSDGNTQGCADIHKYCGGDWKGIENQLDYIKGMGFDAIWISPIPLYFKQQYQNIHSQLFHKLQINPENYGDDYHGYAALNWYNPNPHFGDANSLKSMINVAHSKGIWVMLDVVANHVAYIDTDYSKVTPFNDASHYHDKCQINDWNNQDEVERCRLANLPDLNQDNQDTLKKWISDTVQTYNFDGIRVDTTPHVKVDFWQEYKQSAGVFSIGEVLKGEIGYVANYANNALDATLNYPLYFTLRNVFNFGHSMYEIRDTLSVERTAFHDVDALGVFIDNHDNARFLSMTYSINMLKNALAFTLFSQGIPIVYYGTEQGFAGGNDPANRETLWTNFNTNSDLYKVIAKMNTVRKNHYNNSQFWGKEHIERYCDDHFYAFSRGEVLIVTSNDDKGVQARTITYHPYGAGVKLCDQLNPSDCTTVTGDNKINVQLNGQPKIYVPANSLSFLE